MKKLRIGLIGFGAWAKSAYVPSLQRHSSVEIISATAPSPSTQSLIKSHFGAKVAVFADSESLLARSGVDAVMISTPEDVHEEVLLAALDFGVHVFYEPPVAAQRKRIVPVLKRLLATPRITHANLELGYLPVIGRCRDLLRTGEIGQPRLLGIQLWGNWGPVLHADLCNIHHLCPWYVDVFNQVLGSTASRVLVIDGHGNPGRRQDRSIGHFDFGSTQASLWVNTASVGRIRVVLEIGGDDGDLLADLWTGQLKLRSRRKREWRTERLVPIRPYAGWPGVHECISDFLDSVETERTDRRNALRVAHLHLVGLAADKSRDSGGWETIPTLKSQVLNEPQESQGS